MSDVNCRHDHKFKSIGFGSDGKTYCADCGAETAAFSFMELMGESVDRRKRKRLYRKADLADRRKYLNTKRLQKAGSGVEHDE